MYIVLRTSLCFQGSHPPTSESLVNEKDDSTKSFYNSLCIFAYVACNFFEMPNLQMIIIKNVYIISCSESEDSEKKSWDGENNEAMNNKNSKQCIAFWHRKEI